MNRLTVQVLMWFTRGTPVQTSLTHLFAYRLSCEFPGIGLLYTKLSSRESSRRVSSRRLSVNQEGATGGTESTPAEREVPVVDLRKRETRPRHRTEGRRVDVSTCRDRERERDPHSHGHVTVVPLIWKMSVITASRFPTGRV